MNLHQLAPDEPLSPELVLVLPPELRSQVLMRLGAPVWPVARPRVLVPEPPADPFARSLGEALAIRVVQLGLVFAVVSVGTLAMALVAHAVR